MKKLLVVLVAASLFTGIFLVSAASDQFVDAGSTKKVHFTDTITSSRDLGQGHENHQLALILSPNNGTIYDGSMTFTASKSVQIVVLHEILPQESKGQPIWTADGNTVYGWSLINLQEKAGSFEFTGAALALHSSSPEEFTATVSVDAWIRGQPTEVLIKQFEVQKEEPTLLLSRANVPATIPMHKGIYEEDQVLYIITDSSDEDYAKTLSEKQQWSVQTSTVLADVPDDTLEKLFIFKNGIRGDGIYGFQDEVFSSTPLQESQYSALRSVIEVLWKPGQNEIIFESADDIVAAEESGRIEFEQTGVVLNTPQIVWPDGQMIVRPDKEITDEIQYDGGQIVEINEDEMTVTFVAHRSWGSNGQTIYYIIIDATPLEAAQVMGVASSPTNANLIASTSAVDLFQFKNGIKGSGALGFQPEIASVSLDDENYSPIQKIHLVEWNSVESAKILETISDIDSFHADDLLSVSIAKPISSDYIINSPFIDPFQ